MTNDDPRAPRASLLLHPVVLLALVVWLANDHVLKARFGGPVTGLLSDVSGLVAFPAVLVASAPRGVVARLGVGRTSVLASLATALVFTLVNVSRAASLALSPVLALFTHAHEAVARGELSRLLAPGRHVVDAGDLLALPFALVTPLLALRLPRPRDLRATALVALVALVTSAPPAYVGAEPPRSEPVSDAHVGLHLGTLEVGEPYDRGTYRYRVEGGHVALGGRHRAFRYGVYGTFVHGTLLEAPYGYVEYGVTQPYYVAFSVGVRFGFELEKWRVDIGLLAEEARSADGPRYVPAASAYARVVFGRRDRIALASQVGSTDGFLVDARIFDAGVLVERERFGIRLGLGLGGLIAPDIAAAREYDAGMGLRTSRDERVDFVATVELRAQLTRAVSLESWLQGGTQLVRARVGIGVHL